MMPWFAAIPAASRATAAQVVSAVARGVTQRETIAAIRAAGQPFSRNNPWGRLLAYARGAEQYAQRLRSVNDRFKPGVDKLPWAFGQQRRQFLWTVRINLVDENGARYEKFISVSTDNANMTVQQIKDAARSAYESSSGDPDMEMIGATLAYGTRKYFEE